MRLADNYTDEERPTRPDMSPTRAARRCRHCAHVAGEHVRRGEPRLTPEMVRAGCMGLRENFDPEAHSEADHER